LLLAANDGLTLQLKQRKTHTGLSLIQKPPANQLFAGVFFMVNAFVHTMAKAQGGCGFVQHEDGAGLRRT
jgi:hypothetical protein